MEARSVSYKGGAYGKQSPFFCIIDTGRAFSLSLFDLSLAALQRPTTMSILTSEHRLARMKDKMKPNITMNFFH